MSPENPPIAGELRLLVTSSNDAAFSKVDRTSCDRMVRYGRIHFILFQNIFCMKNWGKIDLFQKTCKFRQILYTLNDTFIVNFSSPRTVFFIITEQGVHYYWMYFSIVVVSARVDPTKVNIKIIISRHLYWLFSWIFIKEAPWLDLNVQHSQTTMAQGPLSYSFPT